MKSAKIYAMVLVMACLTACTSTGFLMAKPQVTLFGPTYPAKDANATIEVFQSRLPDAPYMDIARIEVTDTNDSWSMSQILKSAREIGADAVLFLAAREVTLLGLQRMRQERATA